MFAMQRDITSEMLLSKVSWFAVYVSSRHEKKVGVQLGRRGIESFLPLYRTVHRWRNRSTKRLELPLFPNYLFVHMAPQEHVRVLQVPGVLSMVCCGREPVPVPESVVEGLRVALALREMAPHPRLVVGCRVRIIKGPLCDMEGVLVRKKNNLRIVITLDQIMQSAAVDVNADEIEEIGPPALCA